MGELTVVVFSGVQGHMCIGHVVADVSRQPKDGGQVFLLKCFGESVQHNLHMVRNDSVCEQSVGGELFYRLFPVFRQGIDWQCLFVMVQIDVMSTCLGGIGITALVGVYRMVCNELNMLFVESEQGLWECKNGMLIDGFMAKESPLGRGFV